MRAVRTSAPRAHPELEGKFRIVDGDRRWTNSKILVENQKKEQYRTLPAEVLGDTLTDEERIRVGFTSTGSAKSGIPKKRRWWPTAW